MDHVTEVNMLRIVNVLNTVEKPIILTKSLFLTGHVIENYKLQLVTFANSKNSSVKLGFLALQCLFFLCFHILFLELILLNEVITVKQHSFTTS